MSKGTYLQAARIFFEETKKSNLTGRSILAKGRPLVTVHGRPTKTMLKLQRELYLSVDARMRAEVGWTFEEYRSAEAPPECAEEVMAMAHSILLSEAPS